jgi:hypothetical protein
MLFYRTMSEKRKSSDIGTKMYPKKAKTIVDNLERKYKRSPKRFYGTFTTVDINIEEGEETRSTYSYTNPEELKESINATLDRIADKDQREQAKANQCVVFSTDKIDEIVWWHFNRDMPHEISLSLSNLELHHFYPIISN